MKKGCVKIILRNLVLVFTQTELWPFGKQINQKNLNSCVKTYITNCDFLPSDDEISNVNEKKCRVDFLHPKPLFSN